MCVSLHNPVVATYRLENLDSGRLARALSAWSVTTSASIALVTALWGGLASLTSPRTAIAVAGILLLATPALLPRPARTSQAERPQDASATAELDRTVA